MASAQGLTIKSHNQADGQTAFSSGGLTRKESTSKLPQIVGRIHPFVAV